MAAGRRSRARAFADKFVSELSTGSRHIVDLACSLAQRVLFSGIHNAGPGLKAETFARGLWDAGVGGGQPAAVRVKYSPAGKDGKGLMMKANEGTRFAAGSWPQGEPAVFRSEGAVYNVTEGARFEHDADGHTHSPEERCRSCG